MTTEPTTIIVTPWGDEGYEVSVNGERTGVFANGGIAASHYALQLLEVRRLEELILEQVIWMHSRTPQQVNDLDAGMMRAMAQELKFKAGIE